MNDGCVKGSEMPELVAFSSGYIEQSQRMLYMADNILMKINAIKDFRTDVKQPPNEPQKEPETLVDLLQTGFVISKKLEDRLEEITNNLNKLI